MSTEQTIDYRASADRAFASVADMRDVALDSIAYARREGLRVAAAVFADIAAARMIDEGEESAFVRQAENCLRRDGCLVMS